LLAAFEANFFATLRHHAARACTAAEDRADGRAFAAAGNAPDDRADTGPGTNPRDVFFRRASTAHAAFRINFPDAFITAPPHNLGDLRAEVLPVAAVESNLIERELQFRRAAHFAGSRDARHLPANLCSFILSRFDDARLKAVAALAHV
jgi:hypothetical protein